MNIDLAQITAEAIGHAIRKGVAEVLNGHNSPLKSVVEDACKVNNEGIRAMLYKAVQQYTLDDAMQLEMNESVKKKLGALLVSKFGGELEKSVNELKADPTTRARITLAINQIVEDQLKK